jgi:hypothetical protein
MSPFILNVTITSIALVAGIASLLLGLLTLKKNLEE